MAGSVEVCPEARCHPWPTSERYAVDHPVWTIHSRGTTLTMDALVLALVIVAAILAGIELFTSRGRSLVCWAVEALALALLLPALAAI